MRGLCIKRLFAGQLILSLLRSYPTFADPISLNAQIFHPAFIGSQRTSLDHFGIANMVTVEGTQTGGRRWAWGLQMGFDWADRPLPLIYRADGATHNLISNMVTLHLSGWVNFTDHFALGLSLPLVAYQDKDIAQSSSDPNLGPGTSGLGDLRLVAKWTILNNVSGGFGIALVPQIFFPTGEGSEYRGDDAFVFEPKVALDYRFRSTGILIALNLGFSLRTSSQSVSTYGVPISPHTIISHQARYALGLAVPLPSGFSVMAELSGATNLINAEENLQSPLELYFGARWIHRTGVMLSLGGGPGLTKAVGAANVRAFFTIGYAYLPGKSKAAKR